MNKFNIGDRVKRLHHLPWDEPYEVRGVDDKVLWVCREGSYSTIHQDLVQPWVDPRRERLINLMLPGSGCPVGVYGASAGKLADWLLANGVTIKEES